MRCRNNLRCHFDAIFDGKIQGYYTRDNSITVCIIKVVLVLVGDGNVRGETDHKRNTSQRGVFGGHGSSNKGNMVAQELSAAQKTRLGQIHLVGFDGKAVVVGDERKAVRGPQG